MRISAVWFLHEENEILLFESERDIVTSNFHFFLFLIKKPEEPLSYTEEIYGVMRIKGDSQLTTGEVRSGDTLLEVAMY